MSRLTQQRLKEVLEYYPDAGIFVWNKNRGGGARCGDIAGSILKGFQRQRVQIRIDDTLYYAHRLAFFYMTGTWPIKGVDHKDGDGLNNRWNNLREANQAQNAANQKLRSDNTTGFKGVTFVKRSGRYRASIRVQQKPIHLGYFDTPEAAHIAYFEAAQRHFGKFARAS